MSLPACGFSELVNDAPTLLTNKSQQENASGIKAATATKELRWAAGLDTEGSSTPAAAVSRKPGRLGTPWPSAARAAFADDFGPESSSSADDFGPRDADFGLGKRLAFAAELPGAVESSINEQTSPVCRTAGRKSTPWPGSPKRSEEDESPNVKRNVRWAEGVDILAIPHHSDSESEMKPTLSRRSKRRGTPFARCVKPSEDSHDGEDVDSAEDSECPQQSPTRKPVRRATPWAGRSSPSEQVEEPHGCIRWAAADPLEQVHPVRRPLRKGTPWHVSNDKHDEVSANCTDAHSVKHDGTDRQSVKPDANGPYLWMPFKVPSWLQCCSPVEEKGSEIFLAANDFNAEY